jgi:putative membrane protein
MHLLLQVHKAVFRIFPDRVLRERRRHTDGVSESGSRGDSMTYDNLGNEQPILRDYLAAERTHLANERTLLAYLRTALIVLVTAFTFLKLFEGDGLMRIVSSVLIAGALCIGTIGAYRFRKTRKKLTAFEKQPHDPGGRQGIVHLSVTGTQRRGQQEIEQETPAGSILGN